LAATVDAAVTTARMKHDNAATGFADNAAGKETRRCLDQLPTLTRKPESVVSLPETN
jgi:hypothetical protein